MKIVPILAHGSLGAFDEILLIAVALAFIIMMAISWIRTRNQPLEDENVLAGEDIISEQRETSDRFKLD